MGILQLKYRELSSLDLSSLTDLIVQQHTELYRLVKRVSKNQFISTLDTYCSADTGYIYM